MHSLFLCPKGLQVWMGYLCFHSSIGGHQGGVCLLVVATSAAVTACVRGDVSTPVDRPSA